MLVSFSGANLALVKELVVDDKVWPIHEDRTSSMISADSLPGTGKDHEIYYKDYADTSKSTTLTFSYAAPVIYNITA